MVCSFRPRRAAARRGVSLIEGMVASVVLLIGLVGVFQGIVLASQQNTMANLATHASGVASQTRVALDVMGPDRLLGQTRGVGGYLAPARCEPDESVTALAGGLETLVPGAEPWRRRCIFDLDAAERDAPPANKLLPGYPEEDARRFRRVIVWVSRTDEKSLVTVDQVSVVVSWNEMGRRRFVIHHLGFYDSGSFGNSTGVQI